MVLSARIARWCIERVVAWEGDQVKIAYFSPAIMETLESAERRAVAAKVIHEKDQGMLKFVLAVRGVTENKSLVFDFGGDGLVVLPPSLASRDLQISTCIGIGIDSSDSKAMIDRGGRIDHLLNRSQSSPSATFESIQLPSNLELFLPTIQQADAEQNLSPVESRTFAAISMALLGDSVWADIVYDQEHEEPCWRSTRSPLERQPSSIPSRPLGLVFTPWSDDSSGFAFLCTVAELSLESSVWNPEELLWKALDARLAQAQKILGDRFGDGMGVEVRIRDFDKLRVHLDRSKEWPEPESLDAHQHAHRKLLMAREGVAIQTFGRVNAPQKGDETAFVFNFTTLDGWDITMPASVVRSALVGDSGHEENIDFLTSDFGLAFNFQRRWELPTEEGPSKSFVVAIVSANYMRRLIDRCRAHNDRLEGGKIFATNISKFRADVILFGEVSTWDLRYKSDMATHSIMFGMWGVRDSFKGANNKARVFERSYLLYASPMAAWKGEYPAKKDVSATLLNNTYTTKTAKIWDLWSAAVEYRSSLRKHDTGGEMVRQERFSGGRIALGIRPQRPAIGGDAIVASTMQAIDSNPLQLYQKILAHQAKYRNQRPKPPLSILSLLPARVTSLRRKSSSVVPSQMSKPAE